MTNSDLPTDGDGTKPIRNPDDLLGEAMSHLDNNQVDSLMSKAADEALRLMSKQQENAVDQDLEGKQLETTLDAASRLTQKETKFDIKTEQQSQHGSVFINVRSKPIPILERVSNRLLPSSLQKSNVSTPALAALLVFGVVVLAIIFGSLLLDSDSKKTLDPQNQTQLATTQSQSSVIRTYRVIDGDTLVVSHILGGNYEETIRLLAINTPEKNEDLYSAATAALLDAVQSHPVTLEYETPGIMKRGGYGRVLAYIVIDNKNINVEMVRMGWSKYETQYGRSRFEKEFIAAENEAKINQRGIWSSP